MTLCHAWTLSARPSHIHTASMAQKLRSKLVRRLASRRTVFAAKLLPLSQPLHEDTRYSLLTTHYSYLRGARPGARNGARLGLRDANSFSRARVEVRARPPADLRPSNTASRCARADGPRSGHFSHSTSHSTCMSGGAPMLGPHSTGLSGAQAHVCMLLQIKPNKTL